MKLNFIKELTQLLSHHYILAFQLIRNSSGCFLLLSSEPRKFLLHMPGTCQVKKNGLKWVARSANLISPLPRSSMKDVCQVLILFLAKNCLAISELVYCFNERRNHSQYILLSLLTEPFRDVINIILNKFFNFWMCSWSHKIFMQFNQIHKYCCSTKYFSDTWETLWLSNNKQQCTTLACT